METDPNWLVALLGNSWVGYITLAVTVAAAITAVTPTKVDNEWLQKIVSLLNLIGLNVGQAQNKDDV